MMKGIIREMIWKIIDWKEYDDHTQIWLCKMEFEILWHDLITNPGYSFLETQNAFVWVFDPIHEVHQTGASI